MNENQRNFLLVAARKYIWWKTPEESLLYPRMVLAQVMNIGVWDDLCRMIEFFAESELEDVLDHAEIGQFNGRSWSFWNYRLRGEVPPMPKRAGLQ
jgi:hypothetical protein